MLLDRQKTHELAQALLRARNKRDAGNPLENIAQASTASGDGSSGETVSGGMGFPSVLQPDVMTGDNAASQSREFIPTPRPRPFRDPEISTYAGEVADIAKARGNPARDQLAFHRPPSPSPRPTYPLPGRPNRGAPVPPGYWDFLWEKLLPPYSPPADDNPTFPPLINQLDEADKAACQAQFDRDEKQCYKNYSYNLGAQRRCIDRAEKNRDLCLRGEREMSPWSDVDEDGVRFPSPRKGRKKRQ